MKSKALLAKFVAVILLLPISGYAQFGNILNQLKNAAEKAQQAAQQTQSDGDQKVPVKPQASPPAANTAAQVAGQVAGVNTVKAFRDIWCKSIDSSVSGPIDFKGIKTGDLCQVPDELISAIENKLKRSKQPYEWMTQPKVLKEGGTLAVQNVVAGDKGFFAIALIIDPFKEKVYLGSFTGLICAADATNSLNQNNPFRKALEGKYGSPASAYTEYDQLKAQIDELENQNSNARKQAITVKEAKNARDVDNMLPTLKGMLKAANKEAILSLTWDYEKGNTQRPIGSATIVQARWSQIRDVGGCPVSINDREDYGFMLGVGGTKKISSLEDAIIAQNQANAREMVQKAPAPKF